MLRSGFAHQRVVWVKPHTITTHYIKTHHSCINRAAAHFELVKTEKEKSMTKAKPIYKTKDDQYGTLLAKDSRNWLVLELKGGGGVKAFDPATLEEVVPYTIAIGAAESRRYHIEVDQGSVEVGDILVGGTTLYRVNEVDTKCNDPLVLKTPLRKVGTVPL